MKVLKCLTCGKFKWVRVVKDGYKCLRCRRKKEK